MAQLTLRLSEDRLAALERDAEEQGVSQSEYIRSILDDRHASDVVDVDTFQAVARALRDRERELAECQRTVERLRNEKRTLVNDREEKQEPVAYAKEQRSLERRRHEAGLLTRAKWWLVGGSADDAEQDGEGQSSASSRSRSSSMRRRIRSRCASSASS